MKFVVGALLLSCALAFAPQRHHDVGCVPQQESRFAPTAQDTSSRRDFFDSVLQKTSILVGSSTAALLLPASNDKAWASGGATAGGAYLLSAKQRYNERVKAGVKGFVGIKSALEAGDVAALRGYFANEETGGWKDFTSAAFRRNSTAAPDSLPSVKAWKKFAGAVEGIAKALKKKDTKGAIASYTEALGLLDEYLKQVELPDAKEITMS
eukprot:scaffold17828_cov168-Amphora_coffeaeformis.AAC.1